MSSWQRSRVGEQRLHDGSDWINSGAGCAVPTTTAHGRSGVATKSLCESRLQGVNRKCLHRWLSRSQTEAGTQIYLRTGERVLPSTLIFLGDFAKHLPNYSQPPTNKPYTDPVLNRSHRRYVNWCKKLLKNGPTRATSRLAESCEIVERRPSCLCCKF